VIRALLVLYALGLLAYPFFRVADPESYREVLDYLPQAATADVAQLQTAAGLHWLKNAYLAFIFLLLARFVGEPARRRDLRLAGTLLTAFPLLLLLYEAAAQLVLSPDPDDLDIKLQLRGVLGVYFAMGLGLLGVAGTLIVPAESNPENPSSPKT